MHEPLTFGEVQKRVRAKWGPKSRVRIYPAWHGGWWAEAYVNGKPCPTVTVSAAWEDYALRSLVAAVEASDASADR